jgi:Abortive infection alpha
MSDDSIRQALGRALADFLGPAAREGGQAIADQVRFLRWRVGLRIVERAQRIADEKRLASGHVPLKFLVSFLEQASLQEEEGDLSEMWSHLLAKARESYSHRHVTFLGILNALSPAEAEVLKHMWRTADPQELFSAWTVHTPMDHLERHMESSSLRGGVLLHFDHEVTAHDFAVDSAVVYFFHEDDVPNMNELNFRGAIEISDLIHLQALGLVSVLWDAVSTPKHRHFVVIARLTPFGYDFLEACEGDEE